MKTYAIIIALLTGLLLPAQNNEFQIYPNGLIYDSSTMNSLSYIVDSLNLKYAHCELDRNYYSKYQAVGHYIYLTKRLKKAQEDIKNGIGFEDFIEKYPSADVVENDLIVTFEYENYEGDEVVQFYNYPSEKSFEQKKNRSFDIKKLNSWIVKLSKKNEYVDAYPQAFFVPNGFQSKQLPEKHSRLIQYSDCLIDTNARVFLETAETSGRYHAYKPPWQVVSFFDYLHDFATPPDYESYGEDDYEGYYNDYLIWDSTRLVVADSLNESDIKFQTFLEQAYLAALQDGGSSEELEEYVGRYLSPAKELELKRRRIVIGGCSMDNSPRYHAMRIAELSAQTVNWEIFLRAHLDIMNDNFSRVSDGSYAWKTRNTYILELEQLDIDTESLLFGIALRVDNPADGHYFGSIGRLGRAMSDSQFQDDLKDKMKELMADEELDDFNRLIMYYLYKNYVFNLTEEEQVEAFKELAEAAKELPDFLAKKVK